MPEELHVDTAGAANRRPQGHRPLTTMSSELFPQANSSPQKQLVGPEFPHRLPLPHPFYVGIGFLPLIPVFLFCFQGAHSLEEYAGIEPKLPTDTPVELELCRSKKIDPAAAERHLQAAIPVQSQPRKHHSMALLEPT